MPLRGVIQSTYLQHGAARLLVGVGRHVPRCARRLRRALSCGTRLHPLFCHLALLCVGLAAPSACVRLASRVPRPRLLACGVRSGRRFGGYGRFGRFGLLRLLSLSKTILRVSLLTRFVNHLVYRPLAIPNHPPTCSYRRSSDGRVLLAVSTLDYGLLEICPCNYPNCNP
jgi:hypothetical protein